MSHTSAVASGPIFFFTLDGVMINIPITDVYFDGLSVRTSRTLDASTVNLPAWLELLAKRGDLVPAGKPVTPASLIARAQATGPGGNVIQFEVKPATSGLATQVDITVSELDVYEGLTLGNLIARLGIGGTGGADGTELGLLRVNTKTTGAPDPVVTTDPTITPTTGASPTWIIANSTDGSKPVSLEPKRMGTGFATTDFKVRITDAQAGVFTLSVEWSKTVPNVGMTGTATIPGALDAFVYLVTFLPPSDGTYRLPRIGSATLSGGRDQVDATKATTTILAND